VGLFGRVEREGTRRVGGGFLYDPMKSSNSPSLSPPSGGEWGKGIAVLSCLATARRKVRAPAATRAAKT
jgi:hypothetical protein